MKFFLYILLIINQLCLSQIKNGLVQYGVLKHDQKIDTGDKRFDEYVNKFEMGEKLIAPSLLFDLKFNDQESSFILNDNNIILKENQNFNLFITGLVKNPNYYSNYKTGEFRRMVEFEPIGKVAVSEEQKYKWTLQNETKIIDGITCRKATSPYYINNRIFTTYDYIVTAWYSLEHPVPYGPNGYNNLPGLIMELSTKFSTLYVKKMDFNLKEIEIDRLNSGKILTEDEFRELFLSTLPSDNRKTVEESLKNTNQNKELEKVK